MRRKWPHSVCWLRKARTSLPKARYQFNACVCPFRIVITFVKEEKRAARATLKECLVSSSSSNVSHRRIRCYRVSIMPQPISVPHPRISQKSSSQSSALRLRTSVMVVEKGCKGNRGENTGPVDRKAYCLRSEVQLSQEVAVLFPPSWCSSPWVGTSVDCWALSRP